ncbi:WYL domain-containing protein [Nocardia sp. NPDC005978]|uniref:helix-turn-helix transcriptional regulator n=1 Tax=Nocardia sp. NPDC005978 TaxID=3156725 RepID=UPI0033A6CE4C
MPKTSGRLLALLSLLQARRDWPGALLAERLDISPRTVRRDIDRLRELGYPIATAKGPDGGYRLEAGAELPPLLFDDEQAVAVAVALRTATLGGADISEAALRALQTVRQVMPARLRARMDALRFATVERPGGDPRDRVSSDVLLALSAAVRAREVLRFDYASESAGPQPDSPPRRVEPHHLVVRAGRWYLLAWDLDRADWRTFRADRMTPRIPTGPRFTPRDLPAPDPATFVNAKFRGSPDATAPAWPCTGEAILDLPLSAITPFLHDGTAEPVTPTRTRVTLGSWSWPALAASLGRFDTAIEVIDPPALRTAFADLARRYAAAAQENPPAPGKLRS